MKPELNIHDKTFVPFISCAEIQQMVKALAETLKAELDDNTVFLGVLDGAFLFMSDLIQAIDEPITTAFVKLSSYQGMESTGKIDLQLWPEEQLRSKRIVIVEDIVDTGRSIQFLLNKLQQITDQPITVVSLLVKPEALEYRFENLLAGKEIAKDFVVGYGMDYDGKGRNLNDIYKLK